MSAAQEGVMPDHFWGFPVSLNPELEAAVKNIPTAIKEGADTLGNKLDELAKCAERTAVAEERQATALEAIAKFLTTPVVKIETVGDPIVRP